MSAQLRAEYPLAVVCQTLDIPRSSVYARQHAAAQAADLEVQAHIERIAGQWPTYGYRRMTAQLRREGVGAVNSKRVRRLMHALGLAGHAPSPLHHRPQKTHIRDRVSDQDIADISMPSSQGQPTMCSPNGTASTNAASRSYCGRKE